MKLYDGATVKLRNGEIGKCSPNGDTNYPFIIATSANHTTATERGTYYTDNYAHPRDVVEILDEFQNGELVEVGYENSDVWNQYRYATELNGTHYFYGADGRLIPMEKVRKLPQRGWQWLFRTEEGFYGLTASRYPDEATANMAVTTEWPLLKVEITEGPLA